MLLCLDCIDDECPNYGSDEVACEEYTSLIEEIEDVEKVERDKHFERENDADYWMEQCCLAEAERDALKEAVARFIREIQGEE